MKGRKKKKKRGRGDGLEKDERGLEKWSTKRKTQAEASPKAGEG